MSFKIIKLKKSHERFISRREWLKSMNTFSFGEYSDHDWDDFGKIRVINEDIISPNSGFSMHSHSNMEIITLVIKGAITHKDSLKNSGIIYENEVQVMTAGTGISHSEKNEENKTCKLFQIWIIPNKKNLKPRYEQISVENNIGENIIIDSSNTENNKLFINQDISLWRCKYQSIKDKNLSSIIKKFNWIQIIDGGLMLRDKYLSSDIYLSSGDGLGFEVINSQKLFIESKKGVDFLLFSMPNL